MSNLIVNIMDNYAIVMRKLRVEWTSIIKCDPLLVKEFYEWSISKKRKVKSQRKLAYLFLKHKYGNEWINRKRLGKKTFIDNYEEAMMIARYNWIKVPGED